MQQSRWQTCRMGPQSISVVLARFAWGLLIHRRKTRPASKRRFEWVEPIAASTAQSSWTCPVSVHCIWSKRHRRLLQCRTPHRCYSLWWAGQSSGCDQDCPGFLPLLWPSGLSDQPRLFHLLGVSFVLHQVLELVGWLRFVRFRSALDDLSEYGQLWWLVFAACWCRSLSRRPGQSRHFQSNTWELHIGRTPLISQMLSKPSWNYLINSKKYVNIRPSTM